MPSAPSPSPKESPPATAEYDLRWGVKIPMRDKIELNATLYLSKTTGGQPSTTPVIFTLTPYISDTYHARGAYFASHGYAFALVDVRGRGNSAGGFEPFANEARDGHDVADLRGHRGCDLGFGYLDGPRGDRRTHLVPSTQDASAIAEGPPA